MNAPKTKAAPPPPKRKNFLPEPPAAVPAADNMKAEKLAPMTFNMPKSWHTRFKITAAQRGMNMKELLIECFDAWEEREARK
jgi:hypothetical protein